MVKCGNCGNSLLVFKRTLEIQNKTYYNLQCCGYQKGRCLQSHQLSEKKLLSTLTSSLMEVYPQNSNIYQLSVHTMNTPTEDMQANKEALHKHSIRLQRAKDAYLNGVDTLEEYTVTKMAVTKEITLIEQNIQKALIPRIPNYQTQYTFLLQRYCNLKSSPNPINKTYYQA